MQAERHSHRGLVGGRWRCIKRIVSGRIAAITSELTAA
jgi:hypothetical protein